eukprot:c23901_g1_i1 orf=292-552(+)
MRKCFEFCQSSVKAVLEDEGKKDHQDHQDPPEQSTVTSQQVTKVNQGVVLSKLADSSLRDLAGQAEGFGRDAIGGLYGSLYRVTTL